MYYGNIITVLSSDKEKAEKIADNLGKLHENEKLKIYYRKKGDYIRSVLVPTEYPEKILQTAESVSLSSYCVFYLPIVPSWTEGELALLIASAGCKGEIITEMQESDVRKLLKGLPLEEFPIRQIPEEVEGKEEDKGVVYIDKTFVVKGVGVVVTGFSYMQVKVHDKLKVMPQNKEVEIKSIQVLDEDQEAVDSGIRIGFALRNVKEDEMKEALLLVKSGVKTVKNFSGEIFLFPWTKIESGNYHLVANGVSVMSNLKINGSSVDVELSNELPLSKRFIIVNVNAKQGKPRIAGYIMPK
ncbi:translation elongation factor [Acidianus sp. HS-5]|uniref:translation elongation factor n=1 Tax=Acidianus sp. HS-5 TaxID=2886040 RepID=UPI001F423D0E|nr:translation elongation factor [Acidianus sp. HS-5]BDC19165.1 translation elongation factor [Acidianus sp. HS-5]